MELKLECANILVIESAEICREMVQAFIDSVNNDLDDWIFSESETILKKSTSIEIVTSIFTLDFNNKKIPEKVFGNFFISSGYRVSFFSSLAPAFRNRDRRANNKLCL